MGTILRSKALEEGYHIDEGQRAIAYKGPRFNPRLWHYVMEDQVANKYATNCPTCGQTKPSTKEMKMNDQNIEQEIQSKGLTAPRVTPDAIE